jgi:hypothetical protein
MGPRFASAVVNDPDWTRGSAPEDYFSVVGSAHFLRDRRKEWNS